MTNKTIYIADDHEIITQGISSFLSDKGGNVSSFSNGNDLKKALKEKIPDVLILDLNMPGLNGLEILKYNQEHHHNILTIILTMYNETSLVEKCKKHGAHGYLLKTSSNEDILDAINSSPFVYGPGVKNQTKQEMFKDHFIETTELTPREIEVIQLLSEDFTSEEIADKLNVSPHTINTHRRNLKKKLKVSTIAGLIAFGFENNIISN